MVPKYIKAPQLHCTFKELNLSNVDTQAKYIYLIRKEVRPVRK